MTTRRLVKEYTKEELFTLQLVKKKRMAVLMMIALAALIGVFLAAVVFVGFAQRMIILTVFILISLACLYLYREYGKGIADIERRIR
ncbi:MAG: hypothetical protein KBS66_05065 [Eubacterium sp.]|nr:hypothetical protein [Candidatus Colimonas fimequi]